MKTWDGNIEPKWLRTDEYVSKSFQDSGERNGGCMDENLHGHMPQRKTFENKSRNCARVHLNQTMGGVRVNVINDVRRTRPVRQSSQNMPDYFPQVGSLRTACIDSRRRSLACQWLGQMPFMSLRRPNEPSQFSRAVHPKIGFKHRFLKDLLCNC